MIEPQADGEKDVNDGTDPASSTFGRDVTIASGLRGLRGIEFRN